MQWGSQGSWSGTCVFVADMASSSTGTQMVGCEGISSIYNIEMTSLTASEVPEKRNERKLAVTGYIVQRSVDVMLLPLPRRSQ